MIKNKVRLSSLQEINRISFREDINLLRALAVLGVVFYHAKFQIFSSGYLGVDVFFVISGYLISNIIISEINKEDFKFRNFYLRRVKRILPALFLTLVLTLIPSYILFYPKAFNEYISSLYSSIFFYSNYYFKSLDFYNAEPALYMPLLHTWSLSVEEQFYIIFPILIFLIYKFFPRHVLYFIIFLFAFSFFVTITNSGIDKFYNIEFRAWQFMSGILAMILSSSLKIKKIRYLGFSIILLAFIYFDDDWILDVEPRLLATIGTFLVLISDYEKQLNPLFSNKLLNSIGLSSFSLYLFHQPFFAYSRYYEKVINWEDNQFNDDISTLYKLFLIFILIFFSYFSYKYFEKPFIKNFDFKKIIFLITSFTLIVFYASSSNKLLDIKYKDIDSSYKISSYVDVRSYTAKLNGDLCHDVSIEDTCIFNKGSAKKVILLGDSHSVTLGKYLSEKNTKYQFHILTGDACLYIVNKQPNGVCDLKSKQDFDKYVLNFENSVFIYIGNLSSTDYSTQYELDVDINKTILKLVEKNNYVLLVEQMPTFPFNVIEQYYSGVQWGEPILRNYDEWKNNERRLYIYRIYNKINHPNVIKLSTENIFCNTFVKDECVGAFEDMIYFYDSNHISIDGAQLVGDEIFKEIDKVFSE